MFQACEALLRAFSSKHEAETSLRREGKAKGKGVGLGNEDEEDNDDLVAAITGGEKQGKVEKRREEGEKETTEERKVVKVAKVKGAAVPEKKGEGKGKGKEGREEKAKGGRPEQGPALAGSKVKDGKAGQVAAKGGQSIKRKYDSQVRGGSSTPAVEKSGGKAQKKPK